MPMTPTRARCLIASFALLALGLQAPAQLLWSLYPPGGGAPSYLFGTMHLVPGEYTPSDEVKSAIAASDAFAMEVRLDLSLADQVELARLMMMDPPLQERLDPVKFQQVRAEALALGLKPANFDRLCTFQPIFMAPAVLAMALDPASEVDRALYRYARKKKCALHGFETAEFQLNLLSQIPIEQQLKMFDGPDVWGLMEFEKMAHLYAHERLDSLHAFISDGMETDFPGLEKALLEDRNRAWIPQIEALAAEGTVFVAVGAGHLSGPTGVLALLQERGWRCSPFAREEPQSGR